jgi:chemotaxis signal transduction protein
MTIAASAMPLAADAMHVIALVGTERFAFRVADVEEVLDAPTLLAAPSAPDGLAGQLEHRDRTLRAYDAGWAFGVSRHGAACAALVLRSGQERVALLVDDVEDLASLDASAMRTAPPGTDPSGLLLGVCLQSAGTGTDAALIGVADTAAVVARASSLRGASVSVPMPMPMAVRA